MNKPSILHDKMKLFCALLPAWLAWSNETADANPQGLKVVSGSATATQKGSTLQITASQGALLQWSSFNIGLGQTTIFKQPSATSIVFNKIGSASASKIYGSLEANGIVVLENLNGFYFGPNAFVRAGGLVVTTAAVNPWSSGGGMGWSFDGPPTSRPIVNYGQLETTGGGPLFLIGKEIENKGTISAPGGTAALVAGQEVLVSERPDGLSLSAPVQLAAGSVDNQGKIAADAGQVLLQAQTVNNSGVLQANSVRQKNGVVELYASQDVQLTGSSVIQANGDDVGVSHGGNITIQSDSTFSDGAGSQIIATGGAEGGSGGNVEVSAPNVLSLDSRVEATAKTGWGEGTFTLDPQNIELGSAASGTISGATYMNVNTAFENIGANFQLLASQNITLDAGTAWNLSASTGQTSGELTLEAGGNITLGKQGTAATIKDANDWSVTMQAGNAGQGVVSGTGVVQLFSGSSISTAAGNIDVEAGQSVLLGSGGIVTGIANSAVMTGFGGNINVHAFAGNVDGGTSKSGFNFKSPTLGAVDPALGGISTANGGNVTIKAGGNITDEPTTTADEDPGSGAFGAAPGNVTLIAGGNVTGHYVVADGVGSISANNAGTTAANLSLSLVKGAWDVNAANDIVLQEVRNPNGVFNFNTGGSTPLTYLFDYDLSASVTLDAGDNVTITGSADAKLPRNNNTEGLIFPPTLTIDAGAGGITLDTDVTLFPSPLGTLDIETTGGGGIEGNQHTIDLSDSSRTQYGGTGSFIYSDLDENVFLHLNDPTPTVINVSGPIDDFYVDSPKPLEMHADGNIVNSSANILNLRPSDISSISAGGEIMDQVNFVAVKLQAGAKPNLSALTEAATQLITLPDGTVVQNPSYNAILAPLIGSFYPSSGGLVFYNPIQPQMSLAQYNALLQIHFLDQADLNNIYLQSTKTPVGIATGLSYDIAGPGALKINAASLSLGFGGGIFSQGIVGGNGNNSHTALAPVTPRGADIDISVSGDLSMVASSVESQYGGNINITAGGAIDVGSPLLGQLAAQQANLSLLGIVTLWRGNINVIADGDIDVAGSRVAAYDGGNIFLESLQGSVNAGVGGSGATSVVKPYVNRNGNLQELIDTIPGSGILATSYPELVPGETAGEIGSITVETPEGNIVASKGGIVQLALGPVAQNNATINLDAGSKIGNTVEFVGNVDAAGSGVVGGQVNITATGNINGVVVASVGANVSALQNISATVLSQGGATVSAGGTVSGTIVGVGSVSVSGSSDVAAAFAGGGVTTSGSVSGAAGPAAPVGSSSAAAAATTQQVNSATQANSDVAATDNSDENDPLKKKKKAQLMEYVGRVTVLLPE